MRNTRNKKLVGATMASAVILLGGLGGCGKQETSETLVADAKQFIQKGDTKAAVIQLKNALVKNPSDIEARLTLGTLYNDSGDPASAEKEIRKAVSLGAGPDKTMHALATALMTQGLLQKALDETAPAAAGNDAAILALRGDALLGLGQAEKSKEAYQQALKAKPGFAHATIGLARHALMQKDALVAGTLIDQAVADHPSDPAVWQFKGDLLRSQGKPDDALAAYSQVLKIKPDHRSAHLEKAYIEISAGKFDAANADIEAARKTTPNSLMVNYTQALLDFSQGKHAAAKESLQKVLRVAPEHMPSILLAGVVEHGLGSMTQAEMHLRKYLESFPEHAYARKMLVTTLLKLGQPSMAQGFLAPLMADGGNDPQLLALAGELAMQSRDYGKATEYFEKASKLAPKEATLRTSLAISTMAQGDDARAISELEQSTKLDTSSSKAAVLLVLTELRLKHFDKALAAANALEAVQPKEAMVHNLKGGVYMAKGDLANARASFEKALALQPTYFPAAGNLAQLAYSEKKPEQAKKYLTAFLEKDKKNMEAMAALAELAARQGKPEEVTQWLEKSHAENPDAVAPVVALGKHYLQTRQQPKALTLARKFQVANPKNTDLLDLLGQAQMSSGDSQGALETFSKLAGMAPKSALAQYRLASVHMMLKNPTAAAADLKKALALQPDYLDAQVAQAELAVRDGKWDAALVIARNIQKQRAKNPIGHVLEGNLMLAQGKPALAIRPYEQAFAFAPGTANLVKLHSAMMRAGKTKEAEARLDQWQKTHPDDMGIALYVAESLLAEKKYKPAIGKLEVIVKQAPTNAAALNNLAWAYQQEKDPRALKTAEQALALAADSPQILDTVGNIMVEQGNTAVGVERLQKAVKLAPNDAEIRYHLAQGLAKAGDKASARKELEIVMANKNFARMDEARALQGRL
jgi:putative PEP-CTERM system TPR-repeat lipoprotein